MTIDGPLNLGVIPVYVAEDFVLQIAVRDGTPTAANRYGALVSVAASTKKGVLTIYKPDGTTTITRDTSVSGEGEKADDDSDATNDSYRFLIAAAVTTGWTVGSQVGFHVDHRDSSTTPVTDRPIAYGTLNIRGKPGTTGTVLP